MNDFKGRWKTLTREVKMPVVISEYLGRKKKTTPQIFLRWAGLFLLLQGNVIFQSNY